MPTISSGCFDQKNNVNIHMYKIITIDATVTLIRNIVPNIIKYLFLSTIRPRHIMQRVLLSFLQTSTSIDACDSLMSIKYQYKGSISIFLLSRLPLHIILSLLLLFIHQNSNSSFQLSQFST